MVELKPTLAHAAAGADVALGLANGVGLVPVEHAISAALKIRLGTRITS